MAVALLSPAVTFTFTCTNPVFCSQNVHILCPRQRDAISLYRINRRVFTGDGVYLLHVTRGLKPVFAVLILPAVRTAKLVEFRVYLSAKVLVT
jgi:hypothetical protein